MARHRILMTYSSSEGLEKLLQHPDFVVEVKPKPKPEEFVKLIAGYDGLLIRSEVKVTPEVIQAADRLKVICRAGTGVDNVDIPAASRKGIIVMNVPGGNTISACEHTIGLLMAMMRNIPQACAALKTGSWEREKYAGNELQGKTLGLLGLGRIGSEVAKRMQAFGMRIIAHDPHVSEDHARAMGVEMMSMERVMAEADIISLHLPKTESTKNLINATTIAKMKDGVRIINCARGGIVNEADLATACKMGKVAAAALDVFEKEPTTQSPLFELPNVVVTPHLGASTEEAQLKIAQEVSEMFIDHFIRGITRNAVNIPALDPETQKKVEPYIPLMEKLGAFQSRLIEGGVREVAISYPGSLQGANTYLLTTSYLKEFLATFMAAEINMVSAPVLARERGIKIQETRVSETGEPAHVVRVRVVTDAETCSVAGAVFGNVCRIIEINGMVADIEPAGHILFFANEDKPGVIGRVGTLLGESGINIAQMFVARDRQGGRAMTFITVDGDVPQDVVDKVTSVHGVSRVKAICL